MYVGGASEDITTGLFPVPPAGCGLDENSLKHLGPQSFPATTLSGPASCLMSITVH